MKIRRRNQLKLIASILSIGKISRWAAPVVTSIALPAHAQTSCAIETELIQQLGIGQTGIGFNQAMGCVTAITETAFSAGDIQIVVARSMTRVGIVDVTFSAAFNGQTVATLGGTNYTEDIDLGVYELSSTQSYSVIVELLIETISPNVDPSRFNYNVILTPL